VAELATLSAILAQSDRLGTSVAQALRTQAETMRTRRRQRAEEQAAKTAVKIVFPLVFCIFPALFVVVLGPALMTVFKMFSQVTNESRREGDGDEATPNGNSRPDGRAAALLLAHIGAVAARQSRLQYSSPSPDPGSSIAEQVYGLTTGLATPTPGPTRG
jgi:hypothetical protein